MTKHIKSSYTDVLGCSLEHLYGAASRARPEDISAEVLRINAAVRRLAQQHLTAVQPLVSHQTVMLQEQDSTNQQEP